MRVVHLVAMVMAICVLVLAVPAPIADLENSAESISVPNIHWPPEGGYMATVLAHHNIHRANHSAAPIKWSTYLAKRAARLAETCNWHHDPTLGGPYKGQNIQAGTIGPHVSEAITGSWYNSEVGRYSHLYGEAKPFGFEEWGHFSQIVWKSTTHVGCATRNCTARGGLIDPLTGQPFAIVRPYFTVCNYSPPGNMGGEYAKNVGRPLGHPSIQPWW